MEEALQMVFLRAEEVASRENHLDLTMVDSKTLRKYKI